MIRHIFVVMLNIGAMSVAAGFIGCSRSRPSEIAEGGRMPERTIEQVQEAYTDEWMTIPGVEGTAIGLFEGRPCITNLTSAKPQQFRGKIPSRIEGYPVIIKETGTFHALEQQ